MSRFGSSALVVASFTLVLYFGPGCAVSAAQGFHGGNGVVHSGGGMHASQGFHTSGGGFHSGLTRRPSVGNARPAHSGNGTWHGGREGWRHGDHDRRGYPFFGFPSFVPILPFVDSGPLWGDSSYSDSDQPQEDYGYDAGDQPYPPQPAPYPAPSYDEDGPGPQSPYAMAPPLRGPSPRTYAVPPVPYAATPDEAAPAETSTPEAPITVVLRDGRSFQTQSYAVMGGTLWDLSKPTPHKVPLSDIDVPASQKATDASGGEFPSVPTQDEASK